MVVAALVATALVTIGPAGAHDADGFEDVSLFPVTGATDFDWTPDGRLLVTAKAGLLHVVVDDVVQPTPAIDLTAIVCDDVERGLVGMTVHPDFDQNGWVYLYYTYAKHGNCGQSAVDGPANRASRFTMTGDVLDPASEIVLFETPELYGSNHNSGHMEFGTDGFLYVSVGDSNAPRQWGRPQDPGYLLGKIVRVTDDGDTPPGNPHTGPDSADCAASGRIPVGSAATKCQQVFAQGLRNPFRMAFDPNSEDTRFFINDVGQTLWEEINEGSVGADYGWPVREGPCVFGSQTDCAVPAGVVDPVHWYLHDGGSAITGGAFVPDGLWPSEFDGSYIYADYVDRELYVMEFGGGDCRLCAPPTSPFFGDLFIEGATNVTSMRFGPWGDTQALYVLYGNFLHRIAYTGDANRTPVARATADQVSGGLPLDVEFTGSLSSDPDGDPLTYLWDFGDGTTSTLADPTHTYTFAATHDVTLTVDDGQGGASVASVRVDPGNEAPAVTIDAPTAGTEFAVGQLLTLSGTALDPEEGPLADSMLTWEVLLHHNTHVHPYLAPTAGDDLVITAPAPEDLFAAEDSYLEIILTGTDAQGVATTVTSDVQPRKVDLTFDTVPSGLDVVVDDFVLTTPRTVVSWEGAEVSIVAPPQESGGTAYGGAQWSHGGEASQLITVPASATSYSAAYSDTATITPGIGAVTEGDVGDVVVEVPVMLSSPWAVPVSIDWETVDPGGAGVATAGVDYGAAAGTVTFLPGSTTATVSLTVMGDTTDEPPLFYGEWAFIDFSNPTANAILDLRLDGRGIAVILDDDPPPTIMPGAAGVIEGDVDTTTLAIPVVLSNPSAVTITADWSTLDPGGAGIATGGIDFVTDSGTVSFAPGQTTAFVEITVNGDTVDEPDLLYGEWVLVSFSNPSGDATIDQGFFGLGIGIIVDDDEV